MSIMEIGIDWQQVIKGLVLLASPTRTLKKQFPINNVRIDDVE